ncbi:MAG TPA: UPF0175 family protein [Nodosilinea sp.]|nr:UPF0175 family protein [Nodosilinea sp.]
MQITLAIPDAVAQTPTFAEADWRREIALSLFEQEHLTLGMASQIAGLPLMEFQKVMGSRGLCLHYDVEDFEADMENLHRRGWL